MPSLRHVEQEEGAPAPEEKKELVAEKEEPVAFQILQKRRASEVCWKYTLSTYYNTHLSETSVLYHLNEFLLCLAIRLLDMSTERFFLIKTTKYSLIDNIFYEAVYKSDSVSVFIVVVFYII